MKACRSAKRSVRSWISSSVAMAFASWLILCMMFLLPFLKVVVMLFCISFSCCVLSSS